jgi:2-polyprenyl-6-methoxyphenol hydroxylase-like FAD-dependent oxidoreductase
MRLGERAVVAGSGIAGLLAARVLSDHYEQVVLLERDAFPSAGENRRGVPQGKHTHALLVRGRDILEELFPGFGRDLVDRGAVPYDHLGQMRRFIGGGYYRQAPSGLHSVMATRALMESQVRERVLRLPGVRAIERCDVLGLTATTDGTRITGVRLIQREPGSAEEVLAAALVVDATGRGSRTPAWLESLGYEKPDEERLEVGVCYATRHFRRGREHLGGGLGVLVTPTPAIKRAGVVIAEEGMRWGVTLIGYLGESPPTDGEGFLDFARGLAAPDIHALLREAEPLDDAVSARFPANTRRRYERLARFPHGLLVVGDAMCSFNPTYAQGMTVAALEAQALQDSLRVGDRELAKRYFSAVSRSVDTVWKIAIDADRRLVDRNRRSRWPARLLGWYVSAIHQSARHDAAAALAFLRVAGLLDHPAALLRPGLVARVLWARARSLSKRARHE